MSDFLTDAERAAGMSSDGCFDNSDHDKYLEGLADAHFERIQARQDKLREKMKDYIDSDAFLDLLDEAIKKYETTDTLPQDVGSLF